MVDLRRHLPLVGLLGLTAAGLAVAHVRLIYSVNGNPLYWSDPTSVAITIQSSGSADVPDDSDEVAVRNAIAAWNGVSGTTAQLVEVTSPVQRARTDWNADDLHLVWFDETDASGYFPGSSGTVAITPITFFGSGQILDADVLFNGDDFLFTTRGQTGRFDVQDVVTHELGHLLGLDHTGVAGATMYPYVDTTVILHRSLAQDDVHGLRATYPSSTRGTIVGVVQRGDASPVAGAHVWALDNAGRTIGGCLADASGMFRIEALSPGNYTVRAAPLDDPVSASNLTPGHAIQTDFEAADFGSIGVGTGSTVSLGAQTVGADTSLALGRSFDDLPLRVVSGQTTSHLLRGTGLAPGSTLTASDPGLTVTPTGWFGTSVTFDVTCPGGEAPGEVDLMVTSLGGDVDILPGCLEITPPDPTVTNVSPSAAPGAGGSAITLTGTGFRAGCCVVIGDRVYREGQPGGAVLNSATSLSLTLQSTVGGVHDVVVIDATGVEGRALDGFWAQANPGITSVFPSSGSSAGGTLLEIAGHDFQNGATVTIDGVPQSTVLFQGSDRLQVITEPGVPGGPYVLEVTNPTTEQASAAFVYVAQADPDLAAVSPNVGPSTGGTAVLLSGTDFPTNSQVVFGADPVTGQGGSPASVEFLDPGTLRVVAPAAGAGPASVLVRDPSTGQATVLAGAYTYQSPATAEIGAGGGCGSIAPHVPLRPRDAASGLAWMALLAWWLRARARRLAPARA